MLAKKYRLQVQTLMGKRGTPCRSKLVAGLIFPAEVAWSRFAVVIPARVVKKAARRNALRRRVMGIIKKHSAAWPLADYHLSILPGTETATNEELYESLISLIAR